MCGAERQSEGPELEKEPTVISLPHALPAAVHVVDPSTSPPPYRFSTSMMIAYLDRYHLGVVVQRPADLVASLWHDLPTTAQVGVGGRCR